MDLLQCLLPSPELLQLNSYDIDLDNHRLSLTVSSTQTVVPCPICGSLSGRIHSRYQRTLTDLPCLHFSMSLLVEVCKFFCLNAECRRRIFTERLPTVVSPWARKTLRQVQQLQAIGLALGGAAGSRLGKLLGYFSCGSTLLNHLQRLPLPDFEVPKMLGVDDFAFRKGQQYGTILVNLQTHQPVALLADRKADTLADWLRDHPGVEVFSRDRSKTYKSAMDKAAPDAIQVADRFHLVKNLNETLAIVLGQYGKHLKAAEKAQRKALQAKDPTIVHVAPQKTALEIAAESAQTRHQQRIETQQRIKELRSQFWSQEAISHEVGVSLRTVQRYLSLPDFPKDIPQHASTSNSVIAPFKQDILEWWNSGITDSSVLLALLKQKGFSGTLRTLQRYLQRVREAQGITPFRVKVTVATPKVIDLQLPPFTPNRAAYLITLRPENREPEQIELLEHLVKQHPDLATLVSLAHEFLELLRQRQGDLLDSWLMKALTCKIQSLKKFAVGLMDDYDAVKASMMSEVSNGPVEGLNNRLKMLKRQMYGRARLELLNKRFIMAA